MRLKPGKHANVAVHPVAVKFKVTLVLIPDGNVPQQPFVVEGKERS